MSVIDSKVQFFLDAWLNFTLQTLFLLLKIDYKIDGQRKFNYEINYSYNLVR